MFKLENQQNSTDTSCEKHLLNTVHILRTRCKFFYKKKQQQGLSK